MAKVKTSGCKEVSSNEEVGGFIITGNAGIICLFVGDEVGTGVLSVGDVVGDRGGDAIGDVVGAAVGAVEGSGVTGAGV
jgi:hypothetical protein